MRKIRKRLLQIDVDTGQPLDGFIACVAPKQRNAFTMSREGWFAVSQRALELLAKSNLLRGQDYRVLLALLARLDFENLLVLSQAEIARDLGIRRENVNHSIKRLVDVGVLLKGPRVGVSRSYRLNPNFGWKGNARNHVLTLERTRARPD